MVIKLNVAFVFLFLIAIQAISVAQPLALEIYYDRVPNSNKYIFTINEHVGPPTSTNQFTIYSNSPAANFTATRSAINLVSGNCPAQSNIQVYKSDTIILATIPPTGYRFGIVNCCRIPTLQNIQNPSSRGYYIETTMYPEPGQSFASSSPRFVNHTLGQGFRGLITMSQPAIDYDGDSIYYSLTDVMEGTFAAPAAIPYNSNYSGSFPLSNSYPVLINQQTGTFSAALIQGTFIINIQLSSYRNNVLTSTVNRDFMLISTIPWSFVPTISISNVQSTSGTLTPNGGNYETSLTVGDTLSFTVNGNIVVSDSIFLGGTSAIFSTVATTTGTCTSNCAQLLANPNLFGTDSAKGQFFLIADPSHIAKSDTTKHRVVFYAASQSACKPYQFANLIVDITINPNPSFEVQTNKPASFEIYPTPSSGIIEFANPLSEAVDIEILSLIGNVVLAEKLAAGAQTIDLSNLPKGTYILTVDRLFNSKIILQ
jgi:hypothetical protein